MAERNLEQIVAGCEHFLNGHPRRVVRDWADDIVESLLSLLRNDGYGRGGVVAQVEQRVADLLGKEAAVFMPSGTMAQQIALRIWCDRAGQPRVAFHPTSHLYLHEQMAYRELHHLDATLVGEPDSLMTPEDVAAIVPPVAALLIELPQREIGGQLPTWDDLLATCSIAREHGTRLHMDGARLWECAPYYGRDYAEIAGLFDSVYVSFYKILNGLPGAILAGPADFVDESRIWLRRHGGNLHQQSPSAITAMVGLDRYLPRVPLYVAKALEIAEALTSIEQIRIVPERPPTNMMHLYLSGDPERWVDAALRIAEEDKVGLFFALPPSAKLEVYIGDAGLQLETSRIRELFEKLISLAA